MKTINVNGKKYVLLSQYQKLEQKKVKIITKEVEKIVEKVVEKDCNIFDRVIVDECNICGIIPFKSKKDATDYERNDIIKLQEWGEYKKVPQALIKTDTMNGLDDGEVVTISKSRFSKEYLDKINKTSSVMYGKIDEVFLKWDSEKKEFMENNPVVVSADRKIFFTLAPRIIGDD